MELLSVHRQYRLDGLDLDYYKLWDDQIRSKSAFNPSALIGERYSC
jgi:hypothetical protein